MRVGRGPAFIALSGAGTASPSIHHVCVTMDNFDPDRTMQTLAELGVKKAEGTAAGPLTARIRMRGPEAGGAKEGTPELYFDGSGRHHHPAAGRQVLRRRRPRRRGLFAGVVSDGNARLQSCLALEKIQQQAIEFLWLVEHQPV